jgi:cytidylate kinase
MSVITIGGQTGGGGRLLGPEVARELEADYVDRLILTTAARQMGATVEALHQVEERIPTPAQRFTGFLQRVLERSAATGAGGDPYFGPGTMAYLTQEFEDIPQPTITRGHELESDQYIEAMRSVMAEVASTGNVVLVGRGAGIILRDDPRVLRVGAVASYEVRVARIMERERVGREQAEAIIDARDRARQTNFKRFFDIDDPDDPKLYHLVINTTDVDMGYATQLVVDASTALQEGRLLAGG